MNVSTSVAMLAITALWYGWKEFRKPERERRKGLAVLFLVFGLAYAAWTFIVPLLGAAFGLAWNALMDQRTMLFLGLGALLVLLGLRQMRNPKTKKLGMLNAAMGVLLIGYALWMHFG